VQFRIPGVAAGRATPPGCRCSFGVYGNAKWAHHKPGAVRLDCNRNSQARRIESMGEVKIFECNSKDPQFAICFFRLTKKCCF
jgi:hypothetical protein